MIFFAIPVPLIMGAFFIYMFSWVYHYGWYYAQKQFLNADYLQQLGKSSSASQARFWGHVYTLICYVFRIALFMAGAGLGWFIVLHFWR